MSFTLRNVRCREHLDNQQLSSSPLLSPVQHAQDPASIVLQRLRRCVSRSLPADLTVCASAAVTTIFHCLATRFSSIDAASWFGSLSTQRSTIVEVPVRNHCTLRKSQLCWTEASLVLRAGFHGSRYGVRHSPGPGMVRHRVILCHCRQMSELTNYGNDPPRFVYIKASFGRCNHSVMRSGLHYPHVRFNGRIQLYLGNDRPPRNSHHYAATG
jgi:hypothetical protein